MLSYYLMKIDVLLSGDLEEVADLSQDLSGAGVDGLFTYEGKSDVFFPLVRAGEVTDRKLYTNVAIAIPVVQCILPISRGICNVYLREICTGNRFSNSSPH